MKALYAFLKSVKLAVVLIIAITALALLSTLVPQDRPDAFYRDAYPLAVYRLVTILGFQRFFSSALFLAPVALFTLNLGVCAVDRFVRRARTRAARRYGPDIVHLGLLLLVAGALVTVLSRQEKDFTMGAGDTVQLTGDYAIRLVSFETLTWEDGSPRAWISTVDVLRAGALETPSFPIRVNHPLRRKGVAVYQSSYGNEGTLTFRDGEGAEVTGRVGQGFQDGDSFWYIADIVRDGDVQSALLQEYVDGEVVSMRKLAPADSIGPYALLRLESREVTGLRAVNDPGYLPAAAALAVIGIGLALTFIQKKRDTTA